MNSFQCQSFHNLLQEGDVHQTVTSANLEETRKVFEKGTVLDLLMAFMMMPRPDHKPNGAQELTR